MSLLRYILLFLLFFGFSLYIKAQNGNEIKDDFKNIEKYLEDYFLLDREAIAVHFNKHSFISDEKIWFKGYVFNRKTKLPSLNTTNIHFVLYDKNGTKINDQLFFGFNGTFYGNYTVEKKLSSGTYYAHFYTNWMNNFDEDESSIYEIEIINPYEDEIEQITSIDYNTISISIFPESGTLVENVKTNIVVKASDCNDNPIKNEEINIFNSKNEIVQKIKTNSFGFGKFEIIPQKEEIYYAEIQLKNQKKKSELLKTKSNGIVLTVNNHAIKNKCFIQLKTNENSISSYKNKSIYFVIHQDEKVIIFDKKFNTNETEITFTIENESLFDGINTLRILDENYNEITNRTIFKHPENQSKNITIAVSDQQKDENKFSIITTLVKPNLSLSILPQKSLALNTKNSILSDLLVNCFIREKLPNGTYFFEDESRIKFFELDMFLQTLTEPKYNWNSIKNTPPIQKHDFDIGITIKGTVNNTIANNSNIQIKLFSLEYNINEFTKLNDKNEFFFENLVLTDSSQVNFSMIKNKTEKIEIKPVIQILNRYRNFKHGFKPNLSKCKEITKPSLSVIKKQVPMITNEKIIELENVEVEVKKQEILTRNKGGNKALTGYKITKDFPMQEVSVLFFLERNGFTVNFQAGQEVSVFSRSAKSMSINAGAGPPILFINDVRQFDFEPLRNMFLSEVDEIYLRSTYIEPSVRSNIGKISIYTKQPSQIKKFDPKESKEFVIKNGFSKILPFSKSNYTSQQDEAFENYGTYHWDYFLKEENNELKTTFNEPITTAFFILIEGFTEDGCLISIKKPIKL